jgi:hypothetical protein
MPLDRKNARRMIKAYVYHPFSWRNSLLFSISGFLCGVLVPLIAIGTAMVLYYPQLPDPEMLEDYKPPLVSEVFSSDGVSLVSLQDKGAIGFP